MRLTRLLLLWLVGQTFVLAASAADGTAHEVEIQIKAAYLFKFAGYVDWPASTAAQGEQPLAIGVIGADSLAEELKRLSAERKVRDRPVRVRVVKAGESLAGLQVLYIGAQAGARSKALIESIATQAVLTITEADGLLEAGSMLNFLLIDERIRFEVSRTRAEAGGLKISSRLLSVAYRIDGRAP